MLQTSMLSDYFYCGVVRDTHFSAFIIPHHLRGRDTVVGLFVIPHHLRGRDTVVGLFVSVCVCVCVCVLEFKTISRELRNQ